MQNYATQIKAFIIENFLFNAEGSSLGDDESFLENGIIDSTGILEVVAWIEETFGIRVPDSDLLPENFDTVQRLTTYLQRNADKHGVPAG
ncbi:MAG: acyl carrier protein [Geobacteraceae bacterium]|nr:acyl carrier protein [Geobacteraceae bacterium]NTW79760.1 acyl carrier protein [Geobacteraceae bacterium]